MPRIAVALGPLAVKRLATPGMHAVGGSRSVPPGRNDAAKSWILRAVVVDRRRDIGLGAYPAVSLAEARLKAQACRE